jgi:hypothetical protein
LKRVIGIVGLAAALAVPVAALADQPTSTDKSNAAKECKALLSASGRTNFNTTFGKNKNDKNSYGKCVSTKTREEAAERQAAKSNAAKQCKSEQSTADTDFRAAHDGKSFAETYGAKNASSAYGKCVSTKAKQNKAAADQKDKDTISASKSCRGEQTQNAATFKTTYKNFGQCVSKKAHELAAQREQARAQA